MSEWAVTGGKFVSSHFTANLAEERRRLTDSTILYKQVKLNLTSSFLLCLQGAIKENNSWYCVCVCGEMNRLQIILGAVLHENCLKHVATCVFFLPTAFWSLDLWQTAKRNQVTTLFDRNHSLLSPKSSSVPHTGPVCVLLFSDHPLKGHGE